jgi:hypothetical protein
MGSVKCGGFFAMMCGNNLLTFTYLSYIHDWLKHRYSSALFPCSSLTRLTDSAAPSGAGCVYPALLLHHILQSSSHLLFGTHHKHLFNRGNKRYSTIRNAFFLNVTSSVSSYSCSVDKLVKNKHNK